MTGWNKFGRVCNRIFGLTVIIWLLAAMAVCGLNEANLPGREGLSALAEPWLLVMLVLSGLAFLAACGATVGAVRKRELVQAFFCAAGLAFFLAQLCTLGLGAQDSIDLSGTGQLEEDFAGWQLQAGRDDLALANGEGITWHGGLSGGDRWQAGKVQVQILPDRPTAVLNRDPGRVFYLLTFILAFIGQGLFMVKNRSLGQKD